MFWKDFRVSSPALKVTSEKRGKTVISVKRAKQVISDKRGKQGMSDKRGKTVISVKRAKQVISVKRAKQGMSDKRGKTVISVRRAKHATSKISLYQHVLSARNIFEIQRAGKHVTFASAETHKSYTKRALRNQCSAQETC